MDNKKNKIIRIKKASIKDFAALVALRTEFEAFEARLEKIKPKIIKLLPKIRRQIKNDFADNTKTYFVALKQDTRVGYISCGKFVTFENVGWIGGLYIEPAYRNLGIANKLLNEAFWWLKKQKVKKVRLSVHKNNKIAINLYKNLSFKKMPENYVYLEKKI